MKRTLTEPEDVQERLRRELRLYFTVAGPPSAEPDEIGVEREFDVYEERGGL
jgi:hypothetical protein